MAVETDAGNHTLEGPRQIREGDKVVVQKDDVYQVITVRYSGLISLKQSKIPISCIIGYPIGTTFLFDGVTAKPLLSPASEDLKIEDLNTDSSKDNRNLHDRSENQYLSAEEIRVLKSSGATGNEIMTKLVENSSTFHLRTKLSQEKYLKKKKQSSLRYDSVVQMLLHSNVHAACTVLLAETFSGLLSQAILERLGPRNLGGRLIQFYHGTSPPRLELPNLAEYAKTYAIQFSDVTSLLLTGKLARDHKVASPTADTVEPLQVEDSLQCCEEGEEEEEEEASKEAVGPEGSCSPPRAKVSLRLAVPLFCSLSPCAQVYFPFFGLP
ncbi:unnamed protein product [Dibothriocephalus latus]|uniref:tRNA (adenine(58)-N(1))-methyltransferase non-catalytic subunit TRM6 n=1 Tax=Dibothriocephalus latus TaxID=60516 RepID=A0A3P7NMD3_DIBLA|nr:unnamed protein product [Dibothriocephalus latus]